MHNAYNDIFPHVTPNPYDPDKKPLHGCLANIIAFLLALLLCALLELSLGSCTSTRTVEVVRTDTLTLTQIRHDSIFVGRVERDSVALTQRGDTLILDRWHTRTLTEYRDRWRHDSIYIATHDTIPQPYPVPEYIEKPLSWHQQLRLWLGNILLALLLLAAGYGLFRLWRRFHPL